MPDWTLSGEWPLVLLPVRIETRFRGDNVLVRIYPDDLHIDSHEPVLTADEIAAGKRYWTAVWRAGRGADAVEQAAWDELAAPFGPERAAWVARVLEPRNPQQRPAKAADAPAPAFPALGDPRPAAWTRAPVASGLPTRWRVVIFPERNPAERIVATATKDIARPLVAGPSPAFDPTQLPGDQPPVDDATRWLVDYEAAIVAGMAVTVPAAGVAALGIRRLLVYGVDEARDEQASAQVLSDLLEAHHHTRGLGFVPGGTPTNNTDGAPAGFSASGPEQRAALRVKGEEGAPADADANARMLARALGLPLVTGEGGLARGGTANALARARNAGRREEAEARAMNTVLWPATWGYFLWQMLSPSVAGADILRGRRHFLEHVRAGGPLPALRIGDQPYGVLPVLPLDRWTDREASSDGLGAGTVAFLRRLRAEMWAPSVESVPRVKPGGDAHETLLNVLGMSPASQQFAARSVLGMDYVAYLWRFVDNFELDPTWRTQLVESAQALLGRLGLGTWDPRLGRALFSSDAFRVRAAIVGADPATYLIDVKNATYSALRTAQDHGTAAATPLLYRLARHALLVEIAIAAQRVEALPGAAEYLEPELVDVIPDVTTATLYRRLERTVALPSGESGKLGEYLQAPKPPGDARVSDLVEHRAALELLAGVPVTTLEKLTAETLDLSSHRLDAWITSFATRRLRWMRSRAANYATGAYIGAYGWLHDIRQRDEPDPVESPPTGESDLFTAPDNAGFVHAPSVAQATTAAVLRAAYHSTPAGSARDALAVDLPSARVRLAEWLLDGIRAGQPLSALLGYRVERDLRESQLPALWAAVAPLRRRFPVLGTRVSPDGEPRETVAATDVIDGLALHRARQAGGLDLGVELGLGAPERVALESVLRWLDDAVDALGDALLAEGVHHAVMGNPLRAGAGVDAAGRGEAPPPELEFARTPRTGVAATHRVLVLLRDTAVADWPVSDLQARAAAEPLLNAWVAKLLPQPGRVRWRASAVGGAEADVAALELDLSVLKLSPLDLLYAAPSELEARLADHIHSLPLAGPDARVRLDLTRNAAWPADVLSVADLAELVAGVRELVGSARAATAADVDVPEQPPPDPPADPGLTTRARDAATALATAAAALADPAREREGLIRAAHLGVPAAYPAVPAASSAAAGGQAAAVRDVVARRREAVAALDADLAAHKISAREHDLGVLGEVFGPEFRVLAPFTPARPQALTTALAASTSLQGGDELAAAGWVTAMARLRAGVDRLASALGYAEALATGDELSFKVAQLPYNSGDRWLALPFAGQDPAGTRVALVAHAPGGLDASAAMAGLVVDEWTEVIPRGRETTGLAFHFDTPGAAAPQAILVGVPGAPTPTWTPELVEATITEAFELARLRTVDLEVLHPLDPDPDALTDVGQFLPAAYFTVNVENDAVSTDFTRGM